MPNPTRGDVHVNRPLTNISIAYIQAQTDFVADRVFPNIAVQKQSDRYFQYDRSDFWRDQYRKRGSSVESAGGGWKIDKSPTYFADKWALHKDIDDDVRANEDTPLSMDRDATIWLTQQAMISREVNWAAAFFATGVWTGIDGSAGDITGVASSPTGNQVLQWNDAASTPIKDVKTQATNIKLRTGFRPNKLVIGTEVWDELSEHPDVIDRIKYSGGVGPDNPAVVSRRAVAQLMEVNEILVASGIQATSEENKTFEQSLTTAFIAGKGALLVYANPTPSILTPSGGYTFSWNGLLGAGALGNRIKRFRLEQLNSDRVEGEMAYDQKLVCSDCGVFFDQVVA